MSKSKKHRKRSDDSVQIWECKRYQEGSRNLSPVLKPKNRVGFRSEHTCTGETGCWCEAELMRTANATNKFISPLKYSLFVFCK